MGQRSFSAPLCPSPVFLLLPFIHDIPKHLQWSQTTSSVVFSFPLKNSSHPTWLVLLSLSIRTTHPIHFDLKRIVLSIASVPVRSLIVLFDIYSAIRRAEFSSTTYAVPPPGFSACLPLCLFAALIGQVSDPHIVLSAMASSLRFFVRHPLFFDILSGLPNAALVFHMYA